MIFINITLLLLIKNGLSWFNLFLFGEKKNYRKKLPFVSIYKLTNFLITFIFKVLSKLY